MWLNKTYEDKSILVTALHKVRDVLLMQSKKRSGAKKSRRKKAVIMKFASKELEQIFNSMPIECQKLVTGR